MRDPSLISQATSTSSTWTSGRSGKMSIEGLWVLKNGRGKRKTVQFLSIPRPGSARLRKNVRIVSSKQVFSPGDEEEGETLHNLRIEVGRNSQPRVNREMHPPQGSD